MSKPPQEYGSGYLCVEDRDVLKKRKKRIQKKMFRNLGLVKVKIFRHRKNNSKEGNDQLLCAA